MQNLLATTASNKRCRPMILARNISANAEQIWNDFVSGHQEGTIFHQTRWLEAITETQDVKLIRLGFFEGDQLVGVLPLLRKGRGILSIAASPFIVADTPYLGIVIEKERMPGALLALDRYMRGTWTGYLRIIQRQRIESDLAGLITAGKKTHIVDLRKCEDDLWHGMEGRCRTAIRKGQKSGITISLETGEEIIDVYYRLLAELYARQKMTVPNRKDFFQKIFGKFSGNNLHLLVSRVEGRIIGGIILVTDREWAYYLNGVSNPDFNHLNPNNILLWEGMKLAKSLGARHFDFVVSDIPRLAVFKKSFGGDLTYYSCLEKAYIPGFAMLRKLYPSYKSIRGRLSKQEEL